MITLPSRCRRWMRRMSGRSRGISATTRWAAQWGGIAWSRLQMASAYFTLKRAKSAYFSKAKACVRGIMSHGAAHHSQTPTRAGLNPIDNPIYEAVDFEDEAVLALKSKRDSDTAA